MYINHRIKSIIDCPREIVSIIIRGVKYNCFIFSRPPFTATTQQKLAERICIGRFTRIPTQYSDNLHGVIASLLHTNVSKFTYTCMCRSTCKQKATCTNSFYNGY